MFIMFLMGKYRCTIHYKHNDVFTFRYKHVYYVPNGKVQMYYPL